MTDDEMHRPTPADYSDAAEDFMHPAAKSSVKIKHTTRGITWEIKVVAGEIGLIENLKKEAVKTHKELMAQFHQEE